MSERDELSMIIAERYHAAHQGVTVLDAAIADAILAAGYRKHRTITTAEEVSGMAIDSIVRTNGGVPLELWEGENDEREWRVTGHRPWTDAELTKNLPATVLHEPSAS